MKKNISILFTIIWFVSCSCAFADETPVLKRLPQIATGINLEIPEFLPAKQAPEGRFVILNGVVVFNNPSSHVEDIAVSNLPGEIAARLAQIYRSQLLADPTQRLNAGIKKESAKALSEWLGSDLPRQKKQELKKVYLDSVVQVDDLLRALDKVEINLDQVIDSQAAILANLVVTELKIIQKNESALKKRYVRSYKSVAGLPADNKLKNALNLMYKSFLKGEHLSADKEAIPSFRDRADREGVRKDFRPGFFDEQVLPSLDTKQVCRIIRCQEAYQKVEGDLMVIGWDVKVFSAEHLVDIVIPEYIEYFLKPLHPGLDWEGIFSDWGLVHTSVLVGLWNTTKQYLDVFKIDQERSRIIEHKQYTQYGDSFAEWMVANGATSWLTAEDDLSLVATAHFRSELDAKKWAYGTREVNGQQVNIRGCAYPVGLYGIDWVCHQNANAFAVRRWGIVPVNYPSFTAVYGSFGIQGISTQRDPSANGRQVNNGGIPGSYLYYNTESPYEHGLSKWPYRPILRALDGMLTPEGFNLSYGLDQETGEEIDYRCQYIEKDVPNYFSGANRVFRIVEGRE